MKKNATEWWRPLIRQAIEERFMNTENLNFSADSKNSYTGGISYIKVLICDIMDYLEFLI